MWNLMIGAHLLDLMNACMSSIRAEIPTLSEAVKGSGSDKDGSPTLGCHGCKQ